MISPPGNPDIKNPLVQVTFGLSFGTLLLSFFSSHFSDHILRLFSSLECCLALFVLYLCFTTISSVARFVLLCLCLLGLALTNFSGYGSVTTLSQFFKFGSIVGVVLAIAMFVFLKKHNQNRLFTVSFCTLLLSYVLIDALNTDLDFSTPASSPITVADKQISTGNYGSKYYYVTLQTEPPSDHSVRPEFYEQISAGQDLCLYHHRGGLLIRWDHLDFCPAK